MILGCRHLCAVLLFALFTEDIAGEWGKPRVQAAKFFESFEAYLIDGVEILCRRIA